MENEEVYYVGGAFVKESDLTMDNKRELMQKLVSTYNKTPIELRDHFTKGVLSAVGITSEMLAQFGLQINLEPPQPEQPNSNDKPSSGLIIQF